MATPEVTGEAARKILKEIKEGTPNTPERIEMFRRADETFRNLNPNPFLRVLK
jgi:hypothetical protein